MAAVLVWLSLIAAAARPGLAAAAPSPIGAHSMLQLTDPYPFMRAMFSEAAGMHASVIRVDVAPAIVFGGTPSQAPDFSGLDAVTALAQQYHLQVVADLLTIPWWISDCAAPTDIMTADRCGTDRLSAYGSMIRQIVTRAGSAIHYWEIWNEPDNPQFFTGTPQQYAAMLRTADDAIKAVAPTDQVLLGGISRPASTPWLAQVFATPGADAAHAFDIANVHIRGDLGGLAPDVAGWRRFLASYGFDGPLWVTEHGYPSDPAFQNDAAFRAGPGSQAGYLRASIPALLDAGAVRVFVTERDNLGGPFASEGVLGGQVSDLDVADPHIVEKPAYAAVRAMAACYIATGRDCTGAPRRVAHPRRRPRSTRRTGTSGFRRDLAG